MIKLDAPLLEVLGLAVALSLLVMVRVRGEAAKRALRRGEPRLPAPRRMPRAARLDAGD